MKIVQQRLDAAMAKLRERGDVLPPFALEVDQRVIVSNGERAIGRVLLRDVEGEQGGYRACYFCEVRFSDGPLVAWYGEHELEAV